jgi:hypothetical protein
MFEVLIRIDTVNILSFQPVSRASPISVCLIFLFFLHLQANILVARLRHVELHRLLAILHHPSPQPMGELLVSCWYNQNRSSADIDLRKMYVGEYVFFANYTVSIFI